MAVTQTATHASPPYLTGTFTSAASAADVTETLGFSPSLVQVFLDVTGTNPNILWATSADTAESITMTGSTGVLTSPAVASGLDITDTGFTVDSTVQTNSGVNFWIAFR